MTNELGMHCDAVESRLLDLVCGELSAEESASVRAHASECESCARSLARLEGGRAIARKMSSENVPADAMDAVLAAARAKADESRRAVARTKAHQPEIGDSRPSVRTRAAQRQGREKESSWIAELLRKLGSFASGPQVAMATLLVLMVGIGLWSAPQMSGRESGSPSAVLEPDPEGELGPSAGAIQPAEPLRLEVDPRTDRIVEPSDPAMLVEESLRPIVPATSQASGAAAQESRGTSAEEQALRERATLEDSQAAQALAAAERDFAPGEGVGAAPQGEPPTPGVLNGTGEVAIVERRALPSSLEGAQPAEIGGNETDSATARALGSRATDLREAAAARADGSRFPGSTAGASEELADSRSTASSTAEPRVPGSAPDSRVPASSAADSPASSAADPPSSAADSRVPATSAAGPPSAADSRGPAASAAGPPSAADSRGPAATDSRVPGSAADLRGPGSATDSRGPASTTDSRAAAGAATARRSMPDTVPEPPRLDPDAVVRGRVQMARGHMSAGRYSQCVSAYQSIRDEHPSYGEMGTVLLGQAECQRRLRQYEAAEHTLRLAERYASVRAQAQRERVVVREQRAAAERDTAAQIEATPTERDRGAAEPASER